MKYLILSLCAGLAVGCSNQWREADAGITADEMLSLLNEVSNAQSLSGSGSSLSEALALKDDENVRIYFADSWGVDSPLGPVASVLSLVDFSFLGQPDLTWSQIEEARIFFMDVPMADGTHKNSLILGIRKPGETALSYAGFTGVGSLTDEDMVINLNDKLILRTYDIDEGDLEPVIQMLVWHIDGVGNENYIGKLSTLVGFGD